MNWEFKYFYIIVFYYSSVKTKSSELWIKNKIKEQKLKRKDKNILV